MQHIPFKKDKSVKKIKGNLEINLKDAVFGINKEIKIPRWESCGTCTGTGAKPGTKPEICPTCQGTGAVKSSESMALEAMRLLILASQQEKIAKVTLTVADDVAAYLNNNKRRELALIEDEGGIKAQIIGREGVAPEHMDVVCLDSDDRDVKFSPN